MDDRYNPPEARIEELITKYTPRQLAIAYLRSQRRAREEAAFAKLMGDINEIGNAIHNNDLDGVKAACESAKRHINQHDDISKSG